MENEAPYHQGIASLRRQQLKADGWIGWGPGEWPSSSLDLNPIENLSHIFCTNIRKRKPLALTKAALVVALQEEWLKLDMDIVNYLCDTMPQRLKEVIERKGCSIRF